jgi:hypothetical protein
VLHAADARDSSVTGDELRIEGPGAPSMSLSQVLFKASGMDSLTFAVPRVTRGPMPMSKSVRAGGGGAK